MSQSDSEKPVEALKDEHLLERFKDWFALSSEAFAKQRQRQSEDIEFQVGENQWSEEAKKERKNRPMLSVSLINQPMALVRNQAANAKFGVTLHPVSEKANKELAETKEGLQRRIERDGDANSARMWALDYAIQAGLGWYRINTQYDEDGDNPSDQEIVYERILYQEMVYPDPAAQKADFSDARFCMVAAYVPVDSFRQQYPKASMSTSDDFAGLSHEAPEWVRANDKQLDPLVVECFYKISTTEDVNLGDYTRRRNRDIVRRAVLTAYEILEDEVWKTNGKHTARYIPLVPVVGRELQPISGERRWEGMVRPARDGQVTFNYSISSMVEDTSRLSKAPYVGAKGQFEGFENEWNEANIRNRAYLEYNTKDLDGKPVGPPTPMQIDGTKMQLSIQLAQEAKGFVQAATAVYSMGELEKRQDARQSGRAIMALQQQGDAGTSNFIGNLTSISIPYDAKVILDLMPIVYDRPGRVTQVLGGEDEAKPVMLNQHFVMDQEGRPVPSDPNQQGAKILDLSEGKYSVAVVAGKSFQTQLQEGGAMISTALESWPEGMPLIGDLLFKYQDFPGAKEIADRLKKIFDQGVGRGLVDDKQQGPTPEQLQAQMSGMQQQLQLTHAQLQGAMQEIKTDQAKQQAAIEIARMNNAAKIEVARISASKEASNQAAEAAEERLATGLQLQHEAEQGALDRAHEQELAQHDAAHEVGMAAEQQAHDAVMGTMPAEPGEPPAPEGGV